MCVFAAKVMRTSNSATVVISADPRNPVKVISSMATTRRQVVTIQPSVSVIQQKGRIMQNVFWNGNQKDKYENYLDSLIIAGIF